MERMVHLINNWINNLYTSQKIPGDGRRNVALAAPLAARNTIPAGGRVGRATIPAAGMVVQGVLWPYWEYFWVCAGGGK